MGHLEPVSPKLSKVQGRNLPFDALAAACRIDTRNARQMKIVGLACSEIRAYFHEEVGVPDGVTPQEWEQALARAIHARANAYRERFPNAELTPIALAKWWHQVAQPPNTGRQKQVEAAQPLQNIIEEMHEIHGNRRKG